MVCVCLPCVVWWPVCGSSPGFGLRRVGWGSQGTSVWFQAGGSGSWSTALSECSVEGYWSARSSAGCATIRIHINTQLKQKKKTLYVSFIRGQKARDGVWPPEVEDGFPVFLGHVLDQLHFIQYQVPPAPLQEVSLVFQQQLVWRKAYVEAVGLVPPLQRDKANGNKDNVPRLHKRVKNGHFDVYRSFVSALSLAAQV